MEAVIPHDNEITVEDQKRRAFMNESSVHSYNHTSKKDRIIRVTNGRIFRNGKVKYWLVYYLIDRTWRFVDSEWKDFGSSELFLQQSEFH